MADNTGVPTEDAALPVWVSPPVPECPAPISEPAGSRRTIVIWSTALFALVVVAGAMLFFLIGSGGGSDSASGAVDDLILDMTQDRWSEAYDRFDPSCRDFSADLLEERFDPVINKYSSHSIPPAKSLEPGLNGMLRIVGQIEFAGGEVHSVRADLIPNEPEITGTAKSASSGWLICGFRIDES